jgi:hypothetical protein
MRRSLFSPVSLFAIFLSATFALGEEPQADTPDAKGITLFDKQIKPVLVKHCYECHAKDSEEIGVGFVRGPEARRRLGPDSGFARYREEPADSNASPRGRRLGDAA